MWWQFWKNGNKVGNLPQSMAIQLGWRFGISVEKIKALQHASMSGPMRSLLVRVYDPKLLVNSERTIRGYDDLDIHHSAVQFECRWHPPGGKLEDLVDLRVA